MKDFIKKYIRYFFLAFFGFTFILSLSILIMHMQDSKKDENKYQEIRKEAKKKKKTEDSNRIDFKKLKEQNSDIYAWINMPDTVIDYPVLMSDETKDTDYYLEYNIDHSKGRPGCLYVEKEQPKDFSAFNTIIYGHNMYTSKTMFHPLTYLQDMDYFYEHDKFTIETEDARRTYKIYCAVKRDDYHLLYYYDYANPVGRQKYVDDLKKAAEADTKTSHIRSDIQIDVKKDKLVTLSTCVTRDNTHRYLVVGILVDEKKFL